MSVKAVTAQVNVLSNRTIAGWAAGVLLIATGSVYLLLAAFGTGTPADSVGLDVIRTAASIVLGTGGAAALLLAARRQRAMELDLVQKDRAAEDLRHDASERRVTELYTRSADQLGNEKAAVRLAGLFALERLTQDNPGHRQTIASSICAYLQMPYVSPQAGPISSSAEDAQRVQAVQERRVRTSAIHILQRHVSWQSGTDVHWDVRLDLSEANLAGADMMWGIFQYANVTGTNFTGATLTEAIFSGAEVSGADFTGASMSEVDLRGARWTSETKWPTSAFAAAVHVNSDRNGPFYEVRDHPEDHKWPSNSG